MNRVLVFRGKARDFKAFMQAAANEDTQISELVERVAEITSRAEREPGSYDRMLIALSQEISRRMDAQTQGEPNAAC